MFQGSKSENPCFRALIIIIPKPCPHGKNHVGMVFSKSPFTKVLRPQGYISVRSQHVGVHREKLWLKHPRLDGAIVSQSRARRRTIQNGAYPSRHFSQKPASNTSPKYRQDAATCFTVPSTMGEYTGGSIWRPRAEQSHSGAETDGEWWHFGQFSF